MICRDVDSRMDAHLCNCEQLMSPWVIVLGRHSQKVQENMNLTWQEVRKTDNRTDKGNVASTNKAGSS